MQLDFGSNVEWKYGNKTLYQLTFHRKPSNMLNRMLDGILESFSQAFSKRGEQHCVKYVRIRVFSDPHIPIQGQKIQVSCHTGIYGSE